MYKLHGFCQSGNTFKVAFLLRALNQAWEPKFVDFMNGMTRTGEWREGTNEMGEVPVLDDGARRLTQSGVILTYLATKHGAFGGASDDERLEVLRWLFFDNHKFTSYFASYRFMKAFGPVAPDPAVMNWLRARLDNAFGIVDKHLAAADIPCRQGADDRRHLALRLPVLPSGGKWVRSRGTVPTCRRLAGTHPQRYPAGRTRTTSCPARSSLRDGESDSRVLALTPKMGHPYHVAFGEGCVARALGTSWLERRPRLQRP